MRKLILLPVLLIMGAIYFMGCEETFTEDDALQLRREEIAFNDSIANVRDSLELVTGIIQLSVNLADGNGSGWISGNDSYDGYGGRVKGDPSLAGLVVSVSQFGVVERDSVDETGIATFTDLRTGQISVSVDGPGFTDVDMQLHVKVPKDANGDVGRRTRSIAVLIPVFSTTENTATVSGRITVESDLTDSLPDPAQGVGVSAVIDVYDPSFINTYFTEYELNDEWFYNPGSGSTNPDDTTSNPAMISNTACLTCNDVTLIIEKIAFNDIAFSGITNADGDYTIAVPGGASRGGSEDFEDSDVGLPVQIRVSDFALEQTLFYRSLNGREINTIGTTRASFSSSFNLTNEVSPIPYVPAAVAVFDDPTGGAAELPDTDAEGSAILTESGIESIFIQNEGTGYTQPWDLVVSAPDHPLGDRAEATMTVTDGKVTDVTITDPGTGYLPGSTYGVTEINPILTNAAATPRVTYSIVDLNVTVAGAGYVSAPTITIESGQGTGATAEAVLNGVVQTDITIVEPGSGYICPPEINFIGQAEVEARATPVMTTNNPISDILINYNGLFETTATPDVIISSAVGSGAKADAVLANEGEIVRFTITEAGSGYGQPPTVNFTGGGGRFAAGYATIDLAGTVTGLVITDPGEGYTSAPTVTLSAPDTTGGIQATATVAIGFPIEDIVVTDFGSGYNIAFNDIDPDDYVNEPTVQLDAGAGLITLTDTEVTVLPNLSIRDITLTNPGQGYQTAPAIQITPVCQSGSGAQATCEIRYNINDVIMTSFGSGYEFNSDINVIADCQDCATRLVAGAVLGRGVLEDINLDLGGEGYTAPPNVRLLRNLGDGDFATEDVDIDATVAGGEVTGFTINDNGGDLIPVPDADYTIDISTKLAGAVFSANVYPDAGEIKDLVITNPGSGYVVPPVVEFVNDSTGGSGATATATISNGRVTGVTITNPGSGYVIAPVINFVTPQYTQRATAEVTVNSDGFVTGISIVDPGFGYVENPGVTIQPINGGVGSGAAALVTSVVNGRVDNVYITNRGSGYLNKNIPGPGIGAETDVLGVPFRGNLNNFKVVSGQNYIRDFYFGTGVRESASNEDLEPEQ